MGKYGDKIKWSWKKLLNWEWFNYFYNIEITLWVSIN
jgi:hypothetical protein